MRILITDYHSASNRGDAAILEGTRASLRTAFPNAEIGYLTEYPEAASVINGIESDRQPFARFRWKPRRITVHALATLLLSWLYGHGIRHRLLKRDTLNPYLNCDLVISKGGAFLSDLYMPSTLGRLWSMNFAKNLGKPVVIYGQSIGPISGRLLTILTRRTLNRLDAVILRDQESAEVLSRIGVKNPNIFVLPDVAFALPIGDAGFTPQSVDNDLVEFVDRAPTVSISVRSWGHFASGFGQRDYHKAIASAVTEIVESHDLQVVFASTCTGLDGYHHDDREVALAIVADLPDHVAKSVKVVLGEYSPADLSMLYGKMLLHVGTRMHSCVLAIRSGTPVVAIGYEFKSAGMLEFFGFGQLCLDIDSLTAEALIERVEWALRNRSEIAADIAQCLPAIRDQAASGAEVIRRTLGVA